jgi:hypothetical protein
MFDYFYGQSGEMFSYFRVPKILFRDIRFKDLSTDAKTLYGILLDRMSLSVKNGWLDGQGRVYIIFPIQEVMDALGCADNKATKLFCELENAGLVERKRRGLGKPNLIHADVELPTDGQNDGRAVEQKLHVLLYKSTLPENDLNRALDELRTERRRQKVEYQGAPFADVFLVSLILSDEDSERACIVDVGDTGMSYVIPWGSIPKDLQEPLHRYVSEAEGKLCGYCKEELCNSESGRMVVELYLGKQDGHGSRILY